MTEEVSQRSEEEMHDDPIEDLEELSDDGPELEAVLEGEEETTAELSPEQEEEAQAEEELSDELDRLQTELTDLNDRHLRLVAEFTNYRRRQETEMTEAWGRAQSDLLRRFLDVLDDLQRVSRLDPAEESVTVEAIVEGVDLVERKFLRSLEEAGVKVLDPVGEAFNPETMEAMLRTPTEVEEEDDTVAQVFQLGYLLKGHLIRPARVAVFKAE